MTKRFLAGIALVCLPLQSLQAIFPANIFRLGCSTDQTIEFPCNQTYLIQASAEGTFHTLGRNRCGEKVNILQIWQDTQNSLTMLRGFDSNTPIGRLDSLLNSANDDGVRGHIIPTAQLRAERFNFIAKKRLPFNLFGNILVPVFHMKLSNIKLVDETKNITFTDQLTKTYLTNHLPQTVFELGDGLNITKDWEKTGLGDIELTLSWQRAFRQTNRILKKVLLGLYGGLTIPTGVRQNPDILMPIPFGNDGAFGVIFGGNIELEWWHYFRGGIDTNFLNLFGSSHCRRVKTNMSQTDLILLAETQTLKEWGFTQQYALYFELGNFEAPVSLRTTYRYIKHNRDKLNIFNQVYDSTIANSALSLSEWTQHNMIFALIYESDRAVARLYYELPFNGKNVILSNIFGGYLGFYF